MNLAKLLNVPELAAPKVVKSKKDEPAKRQDASYQDLIATFVTKQRMPFDSWSPYLFNRMLTSQMHFLGLASKLDKFIFKVNDSIMYGLYMYCIPKFEKAPFFSFAKHKTLKEFTEQELEMQKLCRMSDKELNITRHLL